jgi:hypothetical protein
MTYIRNHIRLIAVAASCAALGAGASAIASAGAATSTASHPKAHAGKWGGVIGKAVHGDLLIATKKGFVTVTFDRGVVQSVSGQQLTITEGTKTTNKTVTLTIPTNALVRVNGRKAVLADVSKGQKVRVLQGLKRTRVIAHTPRKG